MRKSLQIIPLIALVLGISASANAQNRVVVTDASLVGNMTYNWTADNIYELDGLVFLEEGGRLFIEPGTRIEAGNGTNLDASALVITRGAQIFAEGTPTNPIVFTSVDDDGTLDESNRGLWGGVVILGRASTNNPQEEEIEGVGTITPEGDDRAFYGGDDDEDNSGVLRYVSIRHSGRNIGSETGNEIQGLTVGALGSGTTIEYVESFASADDGFEFFGGTVNTRYLVSAFNEDDSFDWDQGFRGKHQFWFAIQAADRAGRIAEMDGAGGNENTTPYAAPMISNVTYIGAGVDATPIGDGEELLLFRDNTAGFYYNSVFTDFGSSGPGTGITVEDIDNSGDKPFDSRQRLENDSLIVGNSVWFGFKAGNALTEFAPQDFVQTMLGENDNQIADPQLVGIDRTVENMGLDPRPASGSPALSITLNDMDDPYFRATNYAGAFGPNENWMKGWTTLDEYGYLADLPSSGGAQNRVVVTDASLVGDMTYNWTADNIYELDGLVFLEEGGRLFIEPGTRIEAGNGTNLDASALVITRGAQIFAEGTPTNPIVFTSVDDDGTLDESNRGLWGGVVILGRASTNNPQEEEIEGVGTITPEGDDRAFYGGDDDEDNSGVLRYVSIRHSGRNIGSETGNEIQGLTVGALGSGTTIEYVESFASADDGFEFFGGTVNTRYLVSAFNEDDSFDWDQGFRGKHQFWFAIQAADRAGRIAEMDGAGGNENTTPYAAPMISNVTYIGAGVDATPIGDGEELLLFRDNTAGFYYNSVFTDFGSSGPGTGITVEDIDNSGDKPFDSRQRLENDSLIVGNSVWFGFKAGNALTEFAPQDFVQTMLGENDNQIADPRLIQIDRTVESKMLDPRPRDGGPVTTIDLYDMDDSFFRATNYAGAFGPTSNWMKGWTTLDEYGYLSDNLDRVLNSNEVEDEDNTGIPTEISLNQNYPNPFNPSTNITFNLPQAQNVTLKVYNMLGQVVATLIDNDRRGSGLNTITFDASTFASGIYIYQLTGNNVTLSQKMTLIK
ncbi:MAG: T9SS type A sorting domain-containing protein [Bacteroidota bacterium]